MSYIDPETWPELRVAYRIDEKGRFNLNRDDIGAPKSCTFGGVTRARISSQCLKRSWRKSRLFENDIGEGKLGTRPRKLPELSDAICMAVRADRPGTKAMDFHTAQGHPLRTAEGKRAPSASTVVSYRWYLENASFTAFIEADDTWLARKAGQNGFELLSARELEAAQQSGRHDVERGGSLYVDSYHYQSSLRVTNASQFRAAARA